MPVGPIHTLTKHWSADAPPTHRPGYLGEVRPGCRFSARPVTQPGQADKQAQPRRAWDEHSETPFRKETLREPRLRKHRSLGPGWGTHGSQLRPQEWVGSGGGRHFLLPQPRVLFNLSRVSRGQAVTCQLLCGKRLGVALTSSLVVNHPALTWLWDQSCGPSEPARPAPWRARDLPSVLGPQCTLRPSHLPLHSTHQSALSRVCAGCWSNRINKG